MPQPGIFDSALIRRHLERRPPGAADFVTRLVADDLAERLMAVSRPFSRALVMGPDATVLPEDGRTAAGSFRFERAATILPAPGLPLFDAEALELPAGDYELVVSLLDLQMVEDVPGFLARVRAQLKPDGLFIAAAVGGETLTELRQAFLAAEAEARGGAVARIAPFVPLADAAALLQRARFAMPVADIETHVVRYDSALALMAELKRLGASNPLAERPAQPMTRGLLTEVASQYQLIAGDPDGRVRARLDILWLSGWAPHASQPKPLRPGSAQVSLAKVLGKSRPRE